MTSINEIDSDYKVEQVAARLLEILGTLDHIMVNRQGNGARPHHKDILRLYNDISEFDLSTLWILETHRMRIYEALPENIFHDAALGAISSTEEEIIEQIRKRREEAKNANQFFAPFEQELSYLGVVMHFVENELGRVVSPEVVDIFSHYWPFLKRIDTVSAMIFLHILPFLHKVRGNYHWMEKYLALFTGASVHIKEAVFKTVPPTHTNSYYTLGMQYLGEDMLLAGSFYDGETDIIIEIGPVSANRINDYKPGAPFNIILQEIYNFFIPMNKRYRQHVFSEELNRSFTLGDGSHSTLGYSSYL
jgi:hypothetical protein